MRAAGRINGVDSALPFRQTGQKTARAIELDREFLIVNSLS